MCNRGSGCNCDLLGDPGLLLLAAERLGQFKSLLQRINQYALRRSLLIQLFMPVDKAPPGRVVLHNTMLAHSAGTDPELLHCCWPQSGQYLLILRRLEVIIQTGYKK
ncbi:hypothetical protein D3C79_973320 [compost metagenome]